MRCMYTGKKKNLPLELNLDFNRHFSFDIVILVEKNH